MSLKINVLYLLCFHIYECPLKAGKARWFASCLTGYFALIYSLGTSSSKIIFMLLPHYNILLLYAD